MNEIIEAKIEEWLSGNWDQPTKDEIIRLKTENPDELMDSFYKDLEFGTGGLRGVMGVGTNRMNRFTVARATQGLANYLKQLFSDDIIKVAIAYDSRNNSAYFADILTDVLTSNGIFCYLFYSLRPTPELSFSVRHYGCKAGIMITASHNPKEYNGYKVYWSDGGQLVPPHDLNVINEVNKIKDIDQIKWDRHPELVQIIGEETDEIYLKKILSLSYRNPKQRVSQNLKIVYTPLHGTGITLIPKALNSFGFCNVSVVEEQAVPDGDFPTAPYPNPEEKNTLLLAIEQAEREGADLVMATDPDADRVGVAVRNEHNELVLLNGNAIASLLTYYVLLHSVPIKKLRPENRSGHPFSKFVPSNPKSKHHRSPFVVKTIVTTDLISDIASDFDVNCYNVLTGFKYIAEKIDEFDGFQQFLCGGEESYGFLIGDFVRDKDAVSTCCMIAEMTSWALSQGMKITQVLNILFKRYAFYKDAQISITKKGISGNEEIKQMMNNFRNDPPKYFGENEVVRVIDYLTGSNSTFSDDIIIIEETGLPASDVLQYHTSDGSTITVRPSGTEPKIKFYISVKEKITGEDQLDDIDRLLDQRIENIKRSLQLN